jgi:hypothetical protein
MDAVRCCNIWDHTQRASRLISFYDRTCSLQHLIAFMHSPRHILTSITQQSRDQQDLSGLSKHLLSEDTAKLIKTL